MFTTDVTSYEEVMEEVDRPLTQYPWCPDERGQINTGRRPHECDSRSGGDVSTHRGACRTAGSHEKLQRGKDSPSHLRRSQSWDTLSSNSSLQSRGQRTSTVPNYHVWGTLLQQPWELRGIYNKNVKHNEVVSFLNRERPTAQHHGSHQVLLGECQD